MVRLGEPRGSTREGPPAEGECPEGSSGSLGQAESQSIACVQTESQSIVQCTLYTRDARIAVLAADHRGDPR